MGRDLRPATWELSSPRLAHETHSKACRIATRIAFFALRQKVLHQEVRFFFGFDISLSTKTAWKRIRFD